MKDSVVNAINQLGASDVIDKTANTLSGTIFGSRENQEFQDAAKSTINRHLKRMLVRDGRCTPYGVLFEINKFDKPEVINVQLVSVQFYSTFTVYSMSVDICNKNAELEVVMDPGVGLAYNTARLINTRMNLYVDRLNNDQEFLAVTDAGLIRRLSEDHNIPVGMVAGLWQYLPPTLTTDKRYCDIPKGSKLTLDTDKEAYMTELKSQGISAVLYHLITATPLPVTPDPFDTFIEPPIPSERDEPKGDDLDTFLNSL